MMYFSPAYIIHCFYSLCRGGTLTDETPISHVLCNHYSLGTRCRHSDVVTHVARGYQ